MRLSRDGKACWSPWGPPGPGSAAALDLAHPDYSRRRPGALRGGTEAPGGEDAPGQVGLWGLNPGCGSPVPPWGSSPSWGSPAVLRGHMQVSPNYFLSPTARSVPRGVPPCVSEATAPGGPLGSCSTMRPSHVKVTVTLTCPSTVPGPWNLVSKQHAETEATCLCHGRFSRRGTGLVHLGHRVGPLCSSQLSWVCRTPARGGGRTGFQQAEGLGRGQSRVG